MMLEILFSFPIDKNIIGFKSLHLNINDIFKKIIEEK
jgi:hypothetical protein